MNDWIACKDRLPPVGAWVIVVYCGVVQLMAAQVFGVGFNCVDGYQWGWADDSADPAPLDAITHWQPMPVFRKAE